MHTWDKATQIQNENLKRRLAANQAPAGPSGLSGDLQTLRELLPQLDVRFKVGFVATVAAFGSMLAMLIVR